jgi:hypothetical protein
VGVNAAVENVTLTLRAQLFNSHTGQSLSAELAEELPAGASGREALIRAATRSGESLGRRMLERGAGEFIGRE